MKEERITISYDDDDERQLDAVLHLMLKLIILLEAKLTKKQLVSAARFVLDQLENKV